MQKVKLLWVIYQGAEPASTLDIEMPAAPKVGDRLLLRPPGKTKAEEMCISNVLYVFDEPKGAGQMPTVREIRAEILGW